MQSLKFFISLIVVASSTAALAAPAGSVDVKVSSYRTCGTLLFNADDHTLRFVDHNQPFAQPMPVGIFNESVSTGTLVIEQLKALFKKDGVSHYEIDTDVAKNGVLVAVDMLPGGWLPTLENHPVVSGAQWIGSQNLPDLIFNVSKISVEQCPIVSHG